jgi:hypothetical protein
MQARSPGRPLVIFLWFGNQTDLFRSGSPVKCQTVEDELSQEFLIIIPRLPVMINIYSRLVQMGLAKQQEWPICFVYTAYLNGVMDLSAGLLRTAGRF